MRREWSGIIKNRDWSEFERLAKKEPSQILADTVAELERGLDEKSDRKALRKVLYLLRQAGFEPTELDEHPDSPVESKPFERAFMTSADAKGDTPIYYGIERAGKVRWLTVYINEVTGVTRAQQDTLDLQRSAEMADHFWAAEHEVFVTAEVDPVFALSRVRQAVEKNRGSLPPVIAYWRSIIDAAPGSVGHPADEIKPAKTTPEQRRKVALTSRATLVWRLELGMAAPILTELGQIHDQVQELSEDERTSSIEEIKDRHRKELFTPAIVADHAMRLRDLAHLLNQRGREGAEVLISTANDLQKKAGESEYAKGLLDKTLLLLFQTLQREDELHAGEPVPVPG